VTLTDTGVVAILDGAMPVVNPVPSPVIIRALLGKGADTLNYLVPAPLSLVRTIEYAGGAGGNKFLLDTAAMGGTGVDLLAGSNLNIRYDGSIGRVLSHVSHFDTVVGSTIGFDLQFGAGNDFDIAVILGGPIEDDTSVTGLVNLGSGGKKGAAIANEFGLTVGSGGSTIGVTDDEGGTGVVFDVFGGPKADKVTLTTGFGLFGSGTHPARVRFNTYLDGNNDKFTHTNVGTPTFIAQSSLTVIAQGGGGKDTLLSENTGGVISMGADAVFDLNLFGGASVDSVKAEYTDVAGGDFAFAATGLVRMRLNGEGGVDGVTADLSNTAGSSPLGVWDVQVLGSLGDDKMALFISDLVAGDITYQGGAALLDGGFGKNTFAAGIPLPGTNVLVLNV
jgi:hypothetical protein